MPKWFKRVDENWEREDGVTVRSQFSSTHNKKPWAAIRTTPKGVSRHREDKASQWLRRQSQFGSWGVIRCFETAAACMKAADKDWPVSTKTKRAA